MTKPAQDMIFVSLENWDDIWRRNQFFCAEFMRRNPESKMLFVGLAKDISHNLRHRKWQELSARNGYPVAEFPRITVLHPLKFLPNSWPVARRINEWVTRWQVRRAARKLGLHRPILWLNPHYAVHMVGQMDESNVIYDITDDWTEFKQHDWQVRLIQAQDRELCERANAVIVCSERLHELKKSLARRLYLIPNGVEAEHYRRVLDGAGPLPEPAAGWRRPVIGYTGSIHGDRVDLPLLEVVASAMPEATFALIGPVMLKPEERARLAALPNVVFTGPIPYRDLPEYMRAFDVCLVPHRVTPFTESLNPLKLWEYLAAGKPIVSSKVAGFRDYPQWVRLAEGADEFVAAIRGALYEEASLPAQRREAAAQHSWSSRWDQVEKAMEESAPPPPPAGFNRGESTREPGLRALLQGDVLLLTREYRTSRWRLLRALINPGMQAVFCYRLSHWCHRHRVPLLPLLLNRFAQIFYSVDISPLARIGPGLVLVHCFATVIGAGVEIERDCVIFHGVTLGNRGSEWVGSSVPDGHPQVGAACMFGAGAKALGPIRIGRNCVIGANSVVLADMPPSSVVAGVPARVVGPRPDLDFNLRPVTPPPPTHLASV